MHIGVSCCCFRLVLESQTSPEWKSQASPEVKGQSRRNGKVKPRPPPEEKGVSADQLRPPLAPPLPPDHAQAELETREASPANFLVKIDSFSLLDKYGIQKLETIEFKAGDYMWRLVIYPNGNDDKDHVSVYLAITDTSALPKNWEVNATFSICLFNHSSGNYRFSLGREQRFHALKQEWGFKKFISKKDLTNPSNGFIVDDKCVFGAEVFVNKNTECLSLKSVDNYQYKQEFKITNFSKLKEKWNSEEFTFGDHQWLIDVYPNGNGQGTGSCLSIFLRRVDSNNRTSSERVMPRYTLRIKDQSNNLKHHQNTGSGIWFSASTGNSWGWHSFIKLSSLNDPEKGFIVNDCCVIEVELADVLAVTSTCTMCRDSRTVPVAADTGIELAKRLKGCSFKESGGQIQVEATMYLAQLQADEIEMETREASPAHFLVKIDKFSLLQKHGIQKLETIEFKSGEYKWRLVIYPNGNGTGKDAKDYVSVYLAIANTAVLPSNWEVNATFSFCLFNHVSDKYCYSLGRARRFHALNQVWGFEKFISKKDLTDPLNGYMFEDKCVFGAEVFVNENKAVTECMLLKSVDKDLPYKREFKISNFSTLKGQWVSEKFTFGGHEWMIQVYPNGSGEGAGQCLSIYLHHVVSDNCSSSERVRPCYTIRIKHQSNDHKHHQWTLSDYWFSASKRDGYGWASFIKLSSLNDPKNGFIVKDCCIIEIELALQAISSS
ncbi:hypothetical protein CASFOL_012379 [Castilleja foliolosa]|uniref:MATH domain-containing protein n=1 Tax=Castilleja foliolosa TaxID=1961234 RepID=A0ABD3DI92_9LAMI